ncbi:MAG TPA: DNA-3-methyladenine glycosylase [Acidobacteriota bacterium]|nr:DNA-3-methyladenine glycosylase [Acidobacteriota bacterium]
MKTLPEKRQARVAKAPDPRLRFDPAVMKLKELPREFFRKNTAEVAKELLGAWLACRHNGAWHGARIIETEAYLGSDDDAAHSRRGRRTARVEPMYLDGGHLYVYLVYGLHHCANVVTRTEGIAEAVLLRAAEGPVGTSARLLSGPGRLCAAMGITSSSSGLDLLAEGDIRLFGRPGKRPDIGVSRRIGVDYAGEAAGWPLRFFDRNSPAVSGPACLRTDSLE